MGKNYKAVDKRRHPRFIKRLTATFSVDHQICRGISSDISESGLFIRTTRGLAVNTPIHIELLLPNDKVALLKGIVRRTVRTPISSLKNGMGIEITEKDATFTDFIKSIMGESEIRIPEKDDTPELKTIPFSARKAAQGDPGRTHERRRHKRLGVKHLKIDSEILSASEARVLNISMSGMLLRVGSRLKIGRKYSLRMRYACRLLFVEADVVWSLLLESAEGAGGDIRPIYLAGMQFTNVPDSEIREIISSIELDVGETSSARNTEPAELVAKA